MPEETEQRTEGQFIRDFDGQANKTMYPDQGDTETAPDAMSEDELESLISGDLGSEAPEGEGQEEPDADGVEGTEPTGEGRVPTNAELQQQVLAMQSGQRQMLQAVVALAGRNANAQEGQEGPEGADASALEALRAANPGMDDEGIDWLMKNTKAVANALIQPVVDKVDRLERTDQSQGLEKQVEQFYNQLDAQLDKAGVKGDDNDDLRSLMRENVIARFTANPELRVNQLPKVVTEVKGRFARMQHTKDETRKGALRSGEGLPPPAGRSNRTGAEDLVKKAVNSRRPEMDFGQRGSMAVVKDIIQRASMNQ